MAQFQEASDKQKEVEKELITLEGGSRAARTHARVTPVLRSGCLTLLLVGTRA